MLIVGVLISILITLVPGFMAVRLLRISNLQSQNALLYAIGLGLIFNLIVGIVANFTFGINLESIVGVYIVLFIILSIVSYKLGMGLLFSRNTNWKSTAVIVPIGIYLLAVGLQLQTTLISSNLIGSDIHLEYYYANVVLEQGHWNPMEGIALNTCLGLTLLLPVYSVLTGIELLWVFKVISPLIFAVLPLVLYRMFKMQFGTIVAVLSVLFFITMPMFTMDMVQLVRQQQSELFFVLVVLLLMDDKLSISKKIILSTVFGFGAVTTHYGFSVGFVGYLMIASVVVIVLGRLWRKKKEVEDAKKPLLPRLVLVGIAIISLCVYVSYYNWVISGKAIVASNIPIETIERTAKQVASGISDSVGGSSDATPDATPDASVVSSVSFIERFPFLDPFIREPILQTAIGLDYAEASVLGKVWRVLQYLVEICLVVGFFVLLLKPSRKIKLEYMAFVITSFMLVAGMFLLSTSSYGIGTTRIFQTVLLFTAPLFVIGVGTIGKGIINLGKFRIASENKLLMVSTLVLFIPYFVFNSGVVFELAKCQSVGFIDVPYSIALSGQRVDISSVFDKEDVEAVDWFKENIDFNDSEALYSDAHGLQLIFQRMGFRRDSFKVSCLLNKEDEGYIFLRKRNVDNEEVTYWADYGSRLSYDINEFEVLKDKIDGGEVIFDNGARIVLMVED